MNFTITFGYFGFWHSVTYLLGWTDRPFHPSRQYKKSKVLHNMWYSFLGVVQMTVWEAIFMHCYATNRLPFMSDEQAFSNPWRHFSWHMMYSPCTENYLCDSSSFYVMLATAATQAASGAAACSPCEITRTKQQTTQ